MIGTLAPPPETWWGWIGGAITALVAWIVTVVTTRQKLIDHIKECDRRYADQAARLVRIEQNQDEMLRYLRRGRGA